MTRQRIYRRRSRWLLVLWASLAALVALSGLFVSDDPEASPSSLQRLICAVILVALVLVALRTARLAVIVDDEAGLVIRNIFRTYRLGWDEVSAVAEPPPYGTWGRGGVRVKLKDGRLLSATAFVKGPFDPQSVGQRLVTELQLRLGDR